MPVVVGRRRAAATVAGLVLAMGCATRMPARPSGPASADPSSLTTMAAATRACAGARTMTVEVALAGRAGGQRLSGRVLAGLERGGAVRLEGVAPFGAPLFILVARAEQATLLLPRDRRVLTGATVAEVLERLTGLPLGAGDLLQALTGCAWDEAGGEGRTWPGGWRGVEWSEGRSAWLRERGGTWRVVAADAGRWRADYSEWLNDLPRQVRLRSAEGDVDLVARLQQLEMNTAIVPEAFEVTIPEGTTPMTLDDLRSVAPLRQP